MEKIVFVCVIFGACLAVTNGLDLSNYEISRNKLGSGFGIKEILDFVLGGPGYGNYYPGQYPHGPGGYPGNYPENYPGNYPGGYYPGGHRPPGPPGAHPGCPLCDSSVYSYCSHKEAHDACCCGGGRSGYGCRKTDCGYLHANSCKEFNLISSCCCVDLYKNNVASIGAAVVAPVAVV